MAQTLGVDDDHDGRCGQLGHGFEHLVELLLVLAHHGAHIGRLQQVGHLSRRAGGVDADGDHAHHAATQLGVNPFTAVFADDGDARLRWQTQGHQTQTKLTRMALVIVPGDGAPNAKIFLAQSHIVGALLRPMLQFLREREMGELVHDSHRLRRL